MKPFGLFVLLALVALVTGCDSVPEGYQFPAQRFTRPLEESAENVGTLYGRVLFPSEYTQRSVNFAIDGRSFVSQPDGRFLVKEVPVGEHLLTMQVKSYEPVSERVEVGEDGPAFAGELKLRMARGKVPGRLVSEDGRSAASVAVRLSPLGEAALTDQDGIFQFIGVNAGSHELHVTDDQFFTYNRKFTLDSGEQRNLGNIQVFRRATATLSRNAVLTRPAKPISPVATDKVE